LYFFFFFQAEDGIRHRNVTGVQTCALPIYPSCQGFAPNDRRFYDLYATAVELDVPVLFHTGTTGLGAGVRGGGGIKLGLSRPILDRKSTRLNSSHVSISYAVFCLKKKINVV